MQSITKGVYIFDIEADNLLDDVTKIHCLSIGKVLKSGEVRVVSTTDYDEMRDFFLNKDIIKVGHNIISYDQEVIIKVLGIQPTEKNLIDTLLLSWYLYPNRNTHGLKDFGEDFGIPKPPVEDWQEQPVEVYIHRCEEDVKINHMLWMQQRDYLFEIYNNESEAIKLIKYLNFKAFCIRDQERVGIKLDINRAERVLKELEKEREEKIEILSKAMPPEDIMATKTVPSADKMYKKDGSMSKSWQDWLQFKIDFGIPDDWNEPKIQYVKGTKPGNPNSTTQIKNWLYSLGWEPENFSFNRDKVTGDVKQVPQIGSKEKDGSVCPSVKKLFDKEPALEILDGLGVISHRIGILTGFLRDQKNGRLYASMKGLTNTLRIKHRTIVNLPSVSKKYGQDIRGCLIPDEGHLWVSSDISGLEDATKMHFMYYYDPEFVKEMSTPDWDPHLDVAEKAGFLTPEQVIAHKAGTENHGDTRKRAKVVNFSAVYSVGYKTLARNSGMTEREAKKLLDVYWERNWSVRRVAEDCKVKSVNGNMWLYNPISQLWYSLRSEKDRFSTLNQGAGDFVFNIFLHYTRKLGYRSALQMHDEQNMSVPEDKIDEAAEVLQQAMNLTNEQLKLNVIIKISTTSGNSYAECH